MRRKMRLLRLFLRGMEIFGALAMCVAVGYGIRVGFTPMLVVYAASGIGVYCAAVLLRDAFASLSELD